MSKRKRNNQLSNNELLNRERELSHLRDVINSTSCLDDPPNNHTHKTGINSSFAMF